MTKKVEVTLVSAVKDGYILTIADCVKVMHFAPLHIRKLCRENKIDAIKVRGTWLVRESSARKYEGKRSSKVLNEENARLIALIRELEDELEQLKTK